MTDDDRRTRNGRALRVLIGSPAAGLLPDSSATAPADTILLDLGEDHPSRAGLLELLVWTDGAGDRIDRVRVRVGALHRGAEKLFEVRDYRQILMLADRHDWHAPFAGELAVALLCEQQLGLAVPQRATWLRTLLAEHTRMASHLGFLGWLERRADLPGGDGGPATAAPSLPDHRKPAALRESLRRRLAELTGNRVHPMVTLVGGVGVDASAEWLEREAHTVAEARRCAQALLERLGAHPSESSGLVSADTVYDYGISGPVARASGVLSDLRRDRPYLAYPELAGLLSAERLTGLPGRPGGPWRRFAVLAQEVAQSADLALGCLAWLAEHPGPTSVRTGKILRLPDGEGYLETEAPLGRAGVYLVSRGDKVPWRLKLRTASFNNVCGWEEILRSCRVRDLEVVLASLGYVIGDVDK